MFGTDALLMTIGYVGLGFGVGCFVGLYTLGRMLHRP
jgi:hypothetical protein